MTDSSETTADDEYSDVKGQLVDGHVTKNFFKYTSLEMPVHVQVLKSSKATSKLETKKVEQTKNRWKIRVRLASKNSTCRFLQQIKNRRKLQLQRKL